MQDLRKPPVFVIFNGPSSIQYRNHLFPGPVYGCNLAGEHFNCQLIAAVDRLTVHEITKRGLRAGCIYVTKNQTVPEPERWRGKSLRGIDSGSLAVECAMLDHPERPVYVIGADGVLGGALDTVYIDDYYWRNGNNPREKIYQRHARCLQELETIYMRRITFVTDQKNSRFQTITHKKFRDTFSLELDGQHTEQAEA